MWNVHLHRFRHQRLSQRSTKFPFAHLHKLVHSLIFAHPEEKPHQNNALDLFTYLLLLFTDPENAFGFWLSLLWKFTSSWIFSFSQYFGSKSFHGTSFSHSYAGSLEPHHWFWRSVIKLSSAVHGFLEFRKLWEKCILVGKSSLVSQVPPYWPVCVLQAISSFTVA